MLRSICITTVLFKNGFTFTTRGRDNTTSVHLLLGYIKKENMLSQDILFYSKRHYGLVYEKTS